MAEEDGEKSEAPTAQRRLRARQDGKFAISREAAPLVSLLCAAGAFTLAWPATAMPLLRALRGILGQAGTIAADPATLGSLFRLCTERAAMLLLPALLAGAAGAVAATILQSGPVLHLKGLAPDFSRIDPRRGIARLLSGSGAVEHIKALLKLGVFGMLVWKSLVASCPAFSRALALPPEALAGLLLRLLAGGGAAILGVQLAIVGFDILWVRLRHTRSLRMTRQDVRDEQKDTDGDPHLRARLRNLRRRRARQRMMEAVPRAAVVLTNPTHVAIALSYDRGSNAAPRVVAKGVDEVAARIRARARETRVPLVSNPPLARALLAVPLDHEIPGEHFRAVAAVIAYVWRLDAQRAPPLR